MNRYLKIFFSLLVASLIIAISNINNTSYKVDSIHTDDFEIKTFTQTCLFWGYYAENQHIEVCNPDQILVKVEVKSTLKQLAIMVFTGDLIHINTVEAYCVNNHDFDN